MGVGDIPSSLDICVDRIILTVIYVYMCYA